MNTSINRYLIGNTTHISVAFTDASTNLYTDPTTVTLTVEDPAGVKTAYVYGVAVGLVRTALGQYYMNIPLAIAGMWRFRWDGGGVLPTAGETALSVAASSL